VKRGGETHREYSLLEIPLRREHSLHHTDLLFRDLPRPLTRILLAGEACVAVNGFDPTGEGRGKNV